MAVGTAQESRLAIVIDSRDSEARIERLRRALRGLGGAARDTGRGANDLSRNTDRLSRSAVSSTTAIQRLTSSIGGLQSVFGGLIAAMSVGSIFKTADAMQSLNSKIKLATSSSEEYLAVQGRLRAMAQSNLTEYDSLVDLYASSRRALKQLGKTQNETLAFTENVTKAMFVGGGAASSQAAALVQLGQALASGVLRGDEFNSIAEQAPILLELVAEKMGVTQGALRKLAADGKISSKILYDAISDATEKLSDMAAKMPATMGQAFETVRNQYKYFIDDMLNSTGGFSSIVAGALIGLGENLNSLIPILVAGGLAWGAYALATSTAATTGMAAAITSMTSMGYWFASNTLLINAQITSYLSLTAVIDRYNLNMMLARLTLASYVDLAKTTAAAVQAKAVAMTNAVKATLANIGADIRHGQVLASLAGATRAAAAAIVQKVTSMRAGITAAGAYAASLRVVAGAAAVTATTIKGLGAAFASLGAIIKAHPIMIIGSVLLAFVAASKDAEGKVLGLSGAFSSLGDAVKVLGYVLVDIVGGIKDVATTFGKFIVSMISNSEKGANESSDMFEVFFGNTEGGFVGLLQVMARFADMGGAVMKTFVEALGRGFSNMTIDMSNKFAKMGNFIVDIANRAAEAITNVINGALDKISSAVKYANKLPFVNIEDKGHRAVAKKFTTRFDENKPLNTSTFGYELGKNYASYANDGMANRLQGHIDSMKGDKLEAKANLDLAGAITATGDESDKAKEKKVKNAKKAKEAVDKEAEAYARLIGSYAQQMAAFDREIFDSMASFNTELRKIGYETDSISGKFVDLPKAMKDSLKEAAAALDEQKILATVRDTLNDFERQLALIGKDSTFEQWSYDLNDASNILSTMSDDMKEIVLGQAHLLDSTKLTYEANKSIEETTKGINREIALMATNGSALDEFIYDLNNTDKYANASLDTINALGDALTRLDAMKKGDALSGVMGELQEESPLGKIQADYDRRLAVIEEYEKTHTDMLENAKIARLAIEQSYMDAKQQIMLGQSEAIFSGLAGITKGFLGEQSGVYRALYAIQKGYALSSALLSSKKAIMDAWSNTAGGFWSKAAAAGKVALSTSAITSAIAGLSPQGFKAGGYTGNMGASQVAGVVHGQEYVFDAQATKRIGVDNLNAMRSGKSVGGGDVNINVNVDAKGNAQVSGDNERMGRDMANGIKAVVMDTLRKEKRQGGMLYA